MSASNHRDQALQQLYPQMVEWRRHLHRFPEISYKEKETSAFIAGVLQDMGCDVQTGLGGYGLMVTIEGESEGPTVALRADIDALAIQDQKQVEYASQVPGVMHACGHDAHTATMLGIASYYMQQRKQLSGKRRLLFQASEEISPGGALPLIEHGAMDGVDAVYGVHLWTPLRYGQVASREGALMAAADEFTIEITGKGGHGGLPHDTVDAIVVGSALVTALQTIVSRQVNPLHPAVVTIGTFQAGHTNNIIAGHALLKGTVRTFDPKVREDIHERIVAMVRQVCDLYGATSTLDYRMGYPPVVNDAAETRRFYRVGEELLGSQAVETSSMVMAAEDFAYYLHHKPGCFIFVGAGNPELEAHYAHHHPRFDLDERAMLVSARLMTALAEDYAAYPVV
ncbi:M20 metallopeptidase family protein [Paenibacillus daejeonensis]|uniref:M20 metallopeptidase family protein n=1 Tax=Paenibacillus daejeonensis TaxID=135193 RepID=UPI00035FFACB|nr:amidohydrolase [Paenibacillus daejeonensis]